MQIPKTIAKIPILSFINDIIGIKLSSIKDKTYKRNFMGRIIITISLYFNLASPKQQYSNNT